MTEPRGRPDHRRRRVGRRGRPAARPGRLQRRLPRAGRLARPAGVPRAQARLGAEGPQGVGDEPEHPRPRGGPPRRGRHPGVAAHVQRRRRLDDHLRGRGRGALPSDFRVRSLDGVADDWPLDYDELLPYYDRDRPQFGVSGCPATRPTRRHRGRADAAAADRRSAGLKVARGAHEARLALVAGAQLDQLGALRRAPAVRPARHLPVGCNEGAKASTDLTHWPKAIALGARLVTGARVRRIETNADGPRDGRDLDSTADGREHFQPAQVVVLAANAIGTPRLLLLSALARIPTASPTRPAWSASG